MAIHDQSRYGGIEGVLAGCGLLSPFFGKVGKFALEVRAPVVLLGLHHRPGEELRVDLDDQREGRLVEWPDREAPVGETQEMGNAAELQLERAVGNVYRK